MNLTEPVPIQSRDEAEAAMAIITAVSIEVDECIIRKNKIQSYVQRRQQKIDGLLGRILKQEERLEVWASKDRTNWGENKTLELRQGAIGFREGNRSTEILEGWKEATIIAKMRKLKKFRDYVRTSYAINRQLLLADSKPDVGRLTEKDLKKIGLEIGQEEKFFCKPLDQV